MKVTKYGFNEKNSTPAVLSFYTKLLQQEFAFIDSLYPELVINGIGELPAVGWKVQVDGVWFGDYRVFSSAENIDTNFVTAVDVLTKTIKAFAGANVLHLFVLGKGLQK